jgi:hypothetical protein
VDARLAPFASERQALPESLPQARLKPSRPIARVAAEITDGGNAMDSRAGPNVMVQRLVLAALLAAVCLPVSAAMRCGTELVYEGDSKQELLDNCGPPDEGMPEMHTDVWIYRMDGATYEIQVTNDTVERIRGPEMSEEAPPDDDTPLNDRAVE